MFFLCDCTKFAIHWLAPLSRLIGVNLDYISMKKIILLLVVLLSGAFIAMADDANEQPAKIDAQWFKANYTKAEYMIPMRDGVRLYTAVYTPKNKKTTHPILLNRTPYGCEPYGKKNSAFWQDSIYHNYLLAEYIFVFQDVRGRGMSTGETTNLRPFIENKQGDMTDEASDTYDTIEWLLRKVKRHNSRIGVFGASYDGFYALMAAASGHPAIKAISPQAPVCDWWMGDDFHRNGAFALFDAVSFLPNFGLKERGKATEAPAFESPIIGNAWDYFIKNKPSDISRTLAGRVPFWDEMMQHPNYDDFWQSRNALRAVDRIKVPTLIVGGAFDAENAYGTWALYRALQESGTTEDCRLVIGPWSHCAWRGDGKANALGNMEFSEESLAEFYRNEIEFPFFDHYLRDAESSGATEYGALVFFTGENCWREIGEWNPAEFSSDYTLYLAEDGALAMNKSDISDSFSSYISDPANPVPYYSESDSPRRKEYMMAEQTFVEGRDDVLTFTSLVLEQDVSVAGVIEAELYASISQTDADFVVKVIDMGPDGDYEMLVRGDIMRGRYRKSATTPEAFEPNKIEKITLKMNDVAHTFMAGHRIKIQVQSSWFPLYDMNPQQFIDIYKAESKDFVPCDIRIYHDAEHPSHIQLPIMK